jgi:hypothetical protein
VIGGIQVQVAPYSWLNFFGRDEEAIEDYFAHPRGRRALMTLAQIQDECWVTPAVGQEANEKIQAALDAIMELANSGFLVSLNEIAQRKTPRLNIIQNHPEVKGRAKQMAKKFRRDFNF